jgi:hypothetical protein
MGLVDESTIDGGASTNIESEIDAPHNVGSLREDAQRAQCCFYLVRM